MSLPDLTQRDDTVANNLTCFLIGQPQLEHFKPRREEELGLRQSDDDGQSVLRLRFTASQPRLPRFHLKDFGVQYCFGNENNLEQLEMSS